MGLRVIEGGDEVLGRIRELRSYVGELEAGQPLDRRRQITNEMSEESFYGELVAAAMLSDEMSDVIHDLLARLVTAPDCLTAGEHVRKLFTTRLREVSAADNRPGKTLLDALPDEMSRRLPLSVGLLRVPGWFDVSATGTWLGAPGSGSARPVAPVPLIVAGRTSDALSERQYLTIMWWDPAVGSWRRVQTPREIALTATRIVTLSGRGMPVTSVSARAVVKYLAAFEAANTERLPSVQVTDRLGWWPATADTVDDLRAFVLPDVVMGEPGVVTFQAPENSDDVVRHVKRKGTWTGWCETVGSFAEYPLLFVGLYAVAGSILLPFTGCSNFTLNFSDETSVGKTTAMRLAASAVGKPSETNGYLASWASSQTWRERTSGVLGSCPLLLDELKRARSIDEAVQFVYDHWQGIGGGRGTPTSVQARCSWRSIMLSTGEGPITSATAMSRDRHGGLAGRVIELRGRPMGPENEHNGNEAKRLQRDVLENYGHMVPAMVTRLLDTRPSWPYLMEVYREAVEEYTAWPGVSDRAIGGRLADYLAQISVGRYFVHDVLLVPGPAEDPLPAVADSALSLAADRNRAVRMLYRLRTWLLSNDACFVERARTQNGQPLVPHWGWAGSWPRDSGDSRWTHVLFLQSYLDRLMDSWRVSPAEVIDAWIARGYVDGTRNHPTKMFEFLEKGLTVPCYAIRREAIEGDV